MKYCLTSGIVMISSLLIIGAAYYFGNFRSSAPSSFSFAVLADQDYLFGVTEEPLSKYGEDMREGYRLTREQINISEIDFSVFIGDFQWSYFKNCTQTNYEDRRRLFNQFEQPLILVPGDNDWSDVKGENCPANPLENLKLLRTIMYPTDQSLGKKRMSLIRQGCRPENQMWFHKGVLFFTLHTLGQDDYIAGGSLSDGERHLEKDHREADNINWVKKSFQQAKAIDAQAVVIFTHACRWSSFLSGEKDLLGRTSTLKPSFVRLMQTIFDETIAFAELTFPLKTLEWPIAKKHVCLFYGDLHTFMVFRPLVRPFGKARLEVYQAPEYLEVQVPGPNQGWVEVDVDFEKTQPFAIRVHGVATYAQLQKHVRDSFSSSSPSKIVKCRS